MAYGECKIYNDGSHYIAIPHTTRPSLKRPKAPEEEIEVIDTIEAQEESSPSNTEGEPFELDENNEEDLIENDALDKAPEKPTNNAPKPRKTTRKELFEEAYRKSLDVPKRQRKGQIYEAMRPYFDSDEKCMDYVVVNLDRKQRNLISRRIRMCRKAYMQDFNYFCTFTYDSKLHTEHTFKNKLRHCLSKLCARKGWKYMGVWERSPEKQRLHFHGLFYIPEGSMPGKIIQTNDYNFSEHKRKITNQNIYFIERFGRNDFEPIDDKTRMGEAMAYLMKYMEKSGEKIVYSKGMNQYFISDIMDDDIVCTIGMEDQKFLLFDDFSCWDEGVYMGQVSKEVIAQMRKVN